MIASSLKWNDHEGSLVFESMIMTASAFLHCYYIAFTCILQSFKNTLNYCTLKLINMQAMERSKENRNQSIGVGICSKLGGGLV